jgi:PAS domain S-box-containing protein
MALDCHLNYFAAMGSEHLQPPLDFKGTNELPTRDAYDALLAQFEAVLNALPDRLYETDALGNVFAFWAPSGAPMLLVPPEKLVGHHITEFLPADVCDVTLAALKIACEKGRHPGTCISTQTLKSKLWFELSIAVKRPITGGPEQRLLVLVQDITERKESEAALRQSESRYRVIFETTGTATVIYNDDGLITLSNEEFSKLTGYTKQQVEGKMHWMDVIDPSLLERQLQYHRARQSDPSAAPRRFESRVLGANGKVHEGILTIELIPGTTERVASFLDLSELKQAEHQMFRAEKMASLGQVVAGVTHEINNPNNFIYFNLPILRRYISTLKEHMDRLAEEQPELSLLSMPYSQFMDDLEKLLDNMERGSKRISSIVEELKHYVRGYEEEKRVERIESVVTRAMTLVGKQVRKMVKRLDVDISAGLPPT